MNTVDDLRNVAARISDAATKLDERVTAREAGYVQRIHDLEAENAQLKAERVDLTVLDSVLASLTATADALEKL